MAPFCWIKGLGRQHRSQWHSSLEPLGPVFQTLESRALVNAGLSGFAVRPTCLIMHPAIETVSHDSDGHWRIQSSLLSAFSWFTSIFCFILYPGIFGYYVVLEKNKSMYQLIA